MTASTDAAPPPVPPPPALQRAHGRAAIATKARAGVSALDRLYQEGCAKIRTPRTHSGAVQAVLINASGGLTGGDRISWRAEAGPGTRLVVTTPACERIYRAVGEKPARIVSRLKVGAGARLDWLPQETLLFEGARLERTLEVDLAADARFLGIEAIIVGRRASGETALAAALRDDWRIRREGRLIHAEAARLGAGATVPRRSASALSGAGAFASLCYVGDDAAGRLDALRRVLDGRPGCAASRIGDKLVLRALAPTGERLRHILSPAIVALSGDGAVPRLWTL